MNKQGSLTWQLSSECLWVGKTASIKPILSKQRKHKVRVLSNDNKYNQCIISNIYDGKEHLQGTKTHKILVDMKKKIKKGEFVCSKQREGVATVVDHKYALWRLYQPTLYCDYEVVYGDIQKMTIPQTIDNDVQSDDYQIACGIRRLQKSLTDALYDEHPSLQTLNDMQ